jgi:hypothetical protein
MSSYLEAAAALLRKAAEDNESYCARHSLTDRLERGRERIAMKYAQLAAIEKGLLPAEMAAEMTADLTAGPELARTNRPQRSDGYSDEF